MKKPCINCPFRNDGKGVKLHLNRSTAIAESLLDDKDFPCHKGIGLHNSKRTRCIGAAIFMEHSQPGGMLSNLAFRLAVMQFPWLETADRGLTPDSLDMSAPVSRTVTEFLKNASFPD